MKRFTYVHGLVSMDTDAIKQQRGSELLVVTAASINEQMENVAVYIIVNE